MPQTQPQIQVLLTTKKTLRACFLILWRKNRVQRAINSEIHVPNSVISNSRRRRKDNSADNPQHIR